MGESEHGDQRRRRFQVDDVQSGGRSADGTRDELALGCVTDGVSDSEISEILPHFSVP